MMAVLRYKKTPKPKMRGWGGEGRMQTANPHPTHPNGFCALHLRNGTMNNEHIDSPPGSFLGPGALVSGKDRPGNSV